MTTAREQGVCPVCGELREGGCHACPGAKIIFRGDGRPPDPPGEAVSEEPS